MIFLVITIAAGRASAMLRLRLPSRLKPRLQGVADLVEVRDVAVLDDVLRQRLDRVPLEPVGALAGLGELDHLDRGRRDVDPDERRGLRLEDVEGGSEIFSKHGGRTTPWTAVDPNADKLH